MKKEEIKINKLPFDELLEKGNQRVMTEEEARAVFQAP